MKKIHPQIKIKEWIQDPKIGFSLMHPEDITTLKQAISFSIKNNKRIYHEYRVKSERGYDWHAIDGQPDETVNGKTIIYGAFIDITHHVDYEATLEQIAFDISHVLRRPVTSMLGLVDLIESEEELSSKKLIEYSGHIKTITTELDEFTRNLNEIYSEKKTRLTFYNKFL